MSTFEPTAHPRSDDGKFAAKPVAEAPDVTLGEPAVPLADAMPADGATLVIDEEQFDDFYSFDRVEITRNDDGTFLVEAQDSTNVLWGVARALCEQRGVDPDSIGAAGDVDQAEREAISWLDRHSDDVQEWFQDTSGATIRTDDNWQSVGFGWSTMLPEDAQTDEVLAAADEASDEHPDQVTDFYTDMLAQAEGYTARRDAQG